MITEARKHEIIDLDAVMKQENGRKLLLRILEHTGYFDSSFHPDERQHVFNEGRRAEGLWLYNEMRVANPAQLNNMIKEHNEHG